MGLRDRPVRFCPYTTLRKETSASESPLMRRIGGRKVALIYLLLAVSLAAPIAYSFFQTPQAKLVTLSDLDVRVVTDGKQYHVNETIRAALVVFNDNPYPVWLEPIREMYISGNTISEPDKISSILYLDYPSSFQYISIAANSSQVIHEERFVTRLPGEFRINILGASTVVNVVNSLGA